MASRLSLQTQLEELLGTRNVYFQPPESVKMKYPAIVYELDNIFNSHADDGVYLSQHRYSITLIDTNPDSGIVDKIAQLPTCKFNRHYKGDNLNHWNFSIYF
jgi:hypothetical protein